MEHTQLWRIAALALCIGPVCAQAAPILDDRDAQTGEWGCRPEGNVVVATNPPAFVWRPQPGAISYQWEAARSASFTIGRQQAKSDLPVLCPSRALAEGPWFWRYRVQTKAGVSGWSKVRRFRIAAETTEFVMPDRATLVARLPKAHPRLFVRPEAVAGLRARFGLTPPVAGQDPQRAEDGVAWQDFLKHCEGLHKRQPLLEEPPAYPEGVKPKSDPWRELWWGNRKRTIAVVQAAADLAFAARIGGEARHRDLARKFLLAALAWDPRGPTGYRYNDEAGMPFVYWFSRAYTFLHADLTPKERSACQAMMAIRGAEMYAGLAPRHLFRPYGSHANRAWHFLGEIGIAFHGEIPAAEDWVWFASRVFGAVYPTWSDRDGGWHEGLAYWNSYLGRFTWWADIQEAAYGVRAYDLPFFSKVGEFPMYVAPPGTVGSGFGDLTGRIGANHLAPLMREFARGAGIPTWAWYAESAVSPSKKRPIPSFVHLLRAVRAPVAATAPTAMPTSKVFRGTGLVAMNTSLQQSKDNVQLLFKSSPFGSQSHGYEAQNSFLLHAYGERLLIRTGQRDMYGSSHHRKWMWSTRSTNNITVGGVGQVPHSASSRGAITVFRTTPKFDFTVGEAADAHPKLERYTRRILFAKPDYVVIHDTLRAKKPETFTWWLHAQNPAEISGTGARIETGGAGCLVRWLAPAGLAVSQTDKFDPAPHPRIRLTQTHITARLSKPQQQVDFVTVLRPYRKGDATVSCDAKIAKTDAGYVVTVDGQLVVTLEDAKTSARWGDAAFDSTQR